MKRLLFLDFDGVINTLIFSKEKEEDYFIKRDNYYVGICNTSTNRVSNKQALILVEKLCLEYNLSIVVTSTWSIGKSVDELKEVLYNSGLSRDVDVIGKVEHESIRGRAIEKWLKKNNIKSTENVICILDDDTDMDGEKSSYLKYLIKTDTFVGFTFSDYLKARDLIDLQLKR